MNRRTLRAASTAASVRLLPASMAVIVALLGIKAVAMAETLAEAAPAAPGSASEAGPASHAETPPPANQCAAPSLAEMAGLSQAEVQVLQALTARREALDQRSVEMSTESELVAAAEQRLDQRLAELRRLETTVNELLGNLDDAQEQRIAALVDVYQRMRAKDAATVFDGLDDGVLVQVASRMRQTNLAEVMGRMEPERARALTQMLADRARPPTDGDALLARARASAPAQTAAANSN